MRASFAAVPLLAVVSGCVVAPAPEAPATPARSASLPVQSVRLYETGVGYFEREGRLLPGSDSISLPASHVDDALKTLIVLSDGAPVRVSAVEFESVLSEGLARAQAGLPPGKEQRLTYPVVLESLRGLEVEVVRSDGGRVVGRLIDVTELSAQPKKKEEQSESDASSEGESKPEEKAALTRYAVTLVDARGAVQRLDSESIESLRPTDPALSARLVSAIGTVSLRSAQARRLLRVAASGDAPVRIGYITETPVWRVTYRLILGQDQTLSALQGWALIHNDTDEAWQRVKLEIVNGRPDSYLFPLTAPRYLRRPLAAPDEMSTLPQLANRTVDQIWGDHDDIAEDDGEGEGSGGLGLASIGTTGYGYGSGSGRLAGSHASVSTTDEIDVGNLAATAGSETLASGARFHYRMAEPVTLGAHSSALVPFTTVRVGTELMTRFSWSGEAGRVAVQITNSSAQTLPAGPLAIYQAAGFVGESVVSRLLPGQATWLSYGTDLDVELEQAKARADISSTKLLSFEDERLVEHYVRHREQPIEISNKSAVRRSVCLELPVSNNATVAGADRVGYDRDSKQPLGIFELEAHSKLQRTLVFDEGLKKTLRVESLTDAYLTELAAGKDLKPAARAILLEARELLLKHAEPSKRRKQKLERMKQIDADTARLESTIEKLKGTSGNGTEPLVRRVVQLEELRNQLELEQQELAEAEARRIPALVAILERLNAK